MLFYWMYFMNNIWFLNKKSILHILVENHISYLLFSLIIFSYYLKEGEFIIIPLIWDKMWDAL